MFHFQKNVNVLNFLKWPRKAIPTLSHKSIHKTGWLDITRGILKKKPRSFGRWLGSSFGSEVNELCKYGRLCPLCSPQSPPALKFYHFICLGVFEIPLYWDRIVKSTLYTMLRIILLVFGDYAIVHTLQ